jgi:uncharacterized protein YcfJ
MRTPLAVFLACTMLAGCTGLTDTQQRALTGTAGGAGVGAILGAIGGNAGLGAIAGAGAGLAGGLIYDQVKKSEQSAYARGYAAGRSGRRPPTATAAVSRRSARVLGSWSAIIRNARCSAGRRFPM